MTPPGYHSPAAIDAALDLAVARAGDRAVAEVLGESVEHRPIRAITLAAPGRTPDPACPRAVVLAAIHGVEAIGAEVALGALALLTDAAPASPAAHLLDRADVTVVPVVNVDGHAAALASLARRRKFVPAPRTNSRGVDLNRNFPWPPGSRAHWLPIAGTSWARLPWYRGPSPLSEPETAALAAWMEAHRPYAIVNLHSVGQLVTYPWSWTAEPPADLDRFRTMIDALRAHQPRWRYRWKQSHDWYPIVGSLNDFAYERWGALSITVEVSTPLAAVREDPRKARWWFWSSNPTDPAPHVDNDAAACLAALASVAPGASA